MIAVLGLSPTEVLAIAGLISAIGGFVSTIAGARRTRKETQVECEDQLRVVRLEAADLAAKIYAQRMTGPQ